MSDPASIPMTENLRRLARLKKLASWLDSAVEIPLTGQRIGMDSLFGLIPVVGDFGSALVSLYIVREGMKFGLPMHVVLHMLLNIATDAVIGSIPVAGDLFDIGFKANLRNVALMEPYV